GSEEKYRKLIETSSDAIFIIDTETGIIQDVNKRAEELTGIPAEELVGMHVTQVHPEEEAERYKKIFEDAVKTEGGKIIQEDIVIRHRNGHDIPVEINTSVVQLRSKRVVQSSVRDVTERKRAEGQIKASLKEKEELLNEVHHRVKNNLQIISSLLDLRSMRTQNKEAIDLFADARNKIHTMGLIHSELYHSERFDRIDLKDYIRKLAEYLSHVYGAGRYVALDVKGSGVYLTVTQAIPCALAMNELITNAFKHAFGKGQKGRLEISVQKPSEDTVSIMVKDDGAGIPEEVDIYKTDSLGLKLVRNLVEKQLKGKLHVKRDRGTEFVMEFKVLKEDAEGV
ncbi:MAG: PAS domain S-box protein, partial [Candidatus Brocadiales bacterium]